MVLEGRIYTSECPRCKNNYQMKGEEINQIIYGSSGKAHCHKCGWSGMFIDTVLEAGI